MSKLKCNCGYTIQDYQVDLPYKGALIANGSFFDYLKMIQKGIESLTEATKLGLRKEWVTRHAPGSANLPVDDGALISEIFAQHYFDLRRLVFQCEECGRVWIQNEGSTDFDSYIPEAGKTDNPLFKNDNEFG